ncbi:hypothetical protein [Nonomuraea typhae]|uniref:hypothetical protein n=1 Tax=Nonomuraea typhae TaxID=2603600 RepID=UPI0012F7E5A7|nr:hypothetical protein [Nonomuraea typhae]
MKSTVLARRVAAFGASTAVLAAMVSGLMATPASAATASAGKATTAAAKVTFSKKPKVSVSTPQANPRYYNGACPVQVDVTSRIKVNSPKATKVSYRWLHGDGSKSGIKSVTVGKGTKYVNVKTSIDFDGDVQGWERVQVLSPRKVTSSKGYFEVNCHKGPVRTDKDPKVWARAWASPDSYVGPCTPGDKIDFVGLIKVSDPAWVRYRWVVNGEVVDYGSVKVWDSRRVYYGISPRSSHRGSAVLEILGPDSTSSNRAYYKVWCKDEAPSSRVSVAGVEPPVTNQASCEVSASGVIRSTGRARVEYSWQLNGTTVAGGTAYFGYHGGSESVSMPSKALVGEARKGGHVTLSVSGPNNSDSLTRSYAGCEKPAPAPDKDDEPSTPIVR